MLALYKHCSKKRTHTCIEGEISYSFKHLECLQLHCFCFFGVPSFISKLGLDLGMGDSDFLKKLRVSSLRQKTRCLSFYMMNAFVKCTVKVDISKAIHSNNETKPSIQTCQSVMIDTEILNIIFIVILLKK